MSKTGSDGQKDKLGILGILEQNLLRNIRYVEEIRIGLLREKLGRLQKNIDDLETKIGQYEDCIHKILEHIKELRGKKEIELLIKEKPQTETPKHISLLIHMAPENKLSRTISEIIQEILDILNNDICTFEELHDQIYHILTRLIGIDHKEILDTLFRMIPQELWKIFKNAYIDIRKKLGHQLTEEAEHILGILEAL